MIFKLFKKEEPKYGYIIRIFYSDEAKNLCLFEDALLKIRVESVSGDIIFEDYYSRELLEKLRLEFPYSPIVYEYTGCEEPITIQLLNKIRIKRILE